MRVVIERKMFSMRRNVCVGWTKQMTGELLSFFLLLALAVRSPAVIYAIMTRVAPHKQHPHRGEAAIRARSRGGNVWLAMKNAARCNGDIPVWHFMTCEPASRFHVPLSLHSTTPCRSRDFAS